MGYKEDSEEQSKCISLFVVGKCSCFSEVFLGGHIGNKVCTAAFQVLSDGSCMEQVYDKALVLPLENNDQISLPGGILE